MSYRSQGVPLKSRIIRESDDLVHPMSDGADFTHIPIDDEPNVLTEIDQLKMEIQRLNRDLEYEKRKLQDMTASRDDWKRFAMRLCKEGK